MDFLPTLLAAAQRAAAPCSSRGRRKPAAGAHRRGAAARAQLFWRHKTAEQAAMRDGDWKYLRLGGKEHLFDLAADARERADRSRNEPARLAAMRDTWAAWNATMLPYPDDSFSYDVKQIDADRY